MAFERGHLKLGGRRSGTKNVKARSASEIFERFAFNSLEKAIELIRDDLTETQYRVGLIKEVMKYQFPQLRAIEYVLPEQPNDENKDPFDFKKIMKEPEGLELVLQLDDIQTRIKNAERLPGEPPIRFLRERVEDV